MKRFLFMAAIIIASICEAYPQGTTSINITGIPPVLNSPFINEIENNYYQGQYQMQVTYTNPTNPSPVDFVYEISLTKNGEEIVQSTSEMVTYSPGTYTYSSFDDTPAIRFTDNLIDQFDGDILQQIVRTGVLPEGSFIFEVELMPADPFENIVSIPHLVFFEIRFPQPPILIAPMDGSIIPPVYPVFSWTPVIGIPGMQFEYELLIVEIKGNQTPQQAIDANREHLREVIQQPLFIYTHEYLPLEVGSTYAWMVTATEMNNEIPISDDGKTEIYTFTVEDVFVDFDFDDLESIQLIPGFAEIINLDQLDITTQQTSVLLDGFATLRLDFPDQPGIVDINITAYELEIPLGNITNPIAFGGSIGGNIAPGQLPLEGAGNIISLDFIEWTVFEGLTIEASIIDPTGQYLEATGQLNLQADGLFGTISATGPGGTPLMQLGESPMRIDINSLTATFPGAFLMLDAQVQFFDNPTPCQISEVFQFDDGQISLDFVCGINQNIPLIPNTELVSLYLNNASGLIGFDWNSQSLEFDISATGSFSLHAIDDETYNIPVVVGMSDTEGFYFELYPPTIILNPPPIELGVANLLITRFENPFLSFDPLLNEWDFGVDLDAKLQFPSFDNLEFSGINDITLSKDGITFSEIMLDESDLAWIPDIELAGFGVKVTAFSMQPFTFPWFGWDGLSAGPWDFSFDFELYTPNFGNNMPSCLRNLTLNIEESSFSGGTFSADLPVTEFGTDECTIGFGAGYGISINALGGGISGTYADGSLDLDGHLNLDAILSLGSPFDCDDHETLNLGFGNIKISGDGIIEGEIANIIPECPVKIGPYEAVITESTLRFNATDGEQTANFSASAYIEFQTADGGTSQVHGQLGVDLITGDFYELEFLITEPFVWKIPAEDEVLTFEINEAAIGLDGLYIDGTQNFVVGNQNISVAVNQLLLDLQSFSIKSGSIAFSENFGFQLGIDPEEFSLTYGAVPYNSELELDPGILFNLAGEVVMDSLGLKASGTADAELSFAGIEIEDLSVEFSEDFAFGLDPFKVANGQIDISYQNQTIAIIDEFGFHPSFGFFNIEDVIPAQLPLPKHSIAYLILKENDEFLIDVDTHPEDDFAVVIGTKPGQAVEFVFPVLQGDETEPPSLEVEFSNVVLGLSPLRFESGEIHVSVPEQDSRFDLTQYGIPMSLRQITYGDFDFEELFLEGLFFSGDLILFDEQLGDEAFVSMFVGTDGSLNTTIDIPDLNANIPLVGGSDLAIISVESIAGWAQYQLLQPSLPEFMFEIAGGFEIHSADGHSARAELLMEYTRHGLSMQHFEYDVTSEKPKLDIDPFIFQINEIHTLDLSYDNDDGFDFYAQLDFSFGMRFEDSDTLLIPLEGVEIRPTGFAIPAQEMNDGTEPPLQVPSINLLGFELEPLAFRTGQVTVNVFDFSPGDLEGLIPTMDFALSFPGLIEMAPELEGLSLTVLDAGYQNGSFTGSVEVHQPIVPITIPLGDTAMEIVEFAGNLYEKIEEGEGRQAIDVTIEGSIPAISQFETEETCDPIAFSLTIVEGSGFSGSIENVVPCGSIPLGSMGLAFSNSEITLDFVDGNQLAELSGSASLNIPREDQPDLNISGDLSLDLISGNIMDGAIEISDAFQWHFPATADDPFLTFNVEQARLDSLGLTFKAAGSMNVSEEIAVDVAFDDLVLQLSDLAIVDGQASISSGFAFELLFLPVEWQLVGLDQQMPEDQNVIRMDFQDVGMTLDADGLGFTGEASASIRLPDLPDLPEDDPDDDPEDPGDPGEPDDDEKFYDNLRLVFIDNFRMHMPPTSSAKSGRAEIWLDEDDDSTLLAWYDTDGIGLGDVLGLLPIPDTLGLPTKDIAYMVLKDESGNLLVELEMEEGQRTLKTLDGETIDIVIAGLEDEAGNSPRFSTAFSISVNDAFEITDGSIQLNMADNEYENQPFKVPDLPITLTSLTYEKRADGVGALSASALLDLPESLNEIQVSIDELRFSQHGFEQASFHIGNEDFNPDDDPEISHSFADDAFIFNLHYAQASFGEENEFVMKGVFQSNFFMDEDDETFSPLPFEAGYIASENPGGSWSFSLGLEYTDTLDVAFARFAITEFSASATQDDFSLLLSGVVSLPDLLGDEFAVTIEELSLGTSGISVGDISAEAQEQEFYLFDERVRVLISSISPNYDSQQKVLFVSMDGELEVLEREVVFSNLTVGTDGSFSIGDGVDVNLLTEDMVILENHLIVEQIMIGVTDENNLRLGVTGNVTLPDPFEQTSAFTVHVAQVDRSNVNISVDGPHFQFGDGFEISDDRTQVTLGEFATLDLTAVAIEIDFKHMSNTTFYATAAVYLENDVNKRIEFGEAGNIYDKWGFRYNYNDGFQWNITSNPTGSNPLFTFDAGFFGISIHALATYNDDFGIEIAGSASLLLPEVSGEADFAGFRINSSGIDDIGYFNGGVSFTLMDKVSLSLGDFEYAPDGGVLTLEIEGEDAEMEDPVVETIEITTKRHLVISEASITINGAGNGNGGGFDSFAGGVDEVLFYITADDEMHLYIDNAFLEIGDLANIWVSMRYITADDFFHLSVAGAGEFQTEGLSAGLGVAGKIEKDGDDISFGLFVRADVSPGIPIIPGIITLSGAGGGFYYRPSEDDFDMVRDAAGLTYLETPDFNSDVRFAAFVYAGAGIVGTDPYYIEGTLFLEATDQFTSLYVNGILLGQPQENLFANLYLNVDYGSDTPGVQGLVKVTIDYSPVVKGEGQIGFFAVSQDGNLVWAIYGEKQLQVLGAVNMTSGFIVCNDGLLIDTELSVYTSGWWGHVDGSIEAGIWYIVDSGFGAYGEISADVKVFGATIGGELFAAYVSQHSLFYAAGSVYVDVFVYTGDVDVWVAYQHGSWDGGRGSNEYASLIDQARSEAQSMADAAEQAASEVNDAQQALEDAANIQALVDDIIDFVDDLAGINNQRSVMEANIAYVGQIAPAVVNRLNNVMLQAIDLYEEVELLSEQMENPITFYEGSISGTGEYMEVLENPAIGFDENVADNNLDLVAEHQENLSAQIAFFEEIITNALANLTELEMLIDGQPGIAGGLLNGFNLIVGHEVTIPLNPISFDYDLIDPGISPPGFGPSGSVFDFDPPVSGPQDGWGGGTNGSSNPNFNYLSEQYTKAVESVKRFYAIYASTLWFLHAAYTITEDHDNAMAALIAISISDDLYNQKFPPLIDKHSDFTQSIDELYTIKGEMITTIYGMLHAYAILLEHAMEEDELAEIEDLQTEMAQKMEPPVISSFIINPNYFMARNRADIEWVAQHPDEVVETSYSIQDSGVGPFTSAGDLQSIEHYTFRRHLDEAERDYVVAIRARGSGGNTAIQVANITLSVSTAGDDSPGGDQVPDDILPPSLPSVSFPYNYTAFSGVLGNFKRYYSSNPGKIDLTITAHSEQSDITSFDFAVGTSMGSTNVLDWTTAVGVIEPIDVGEGGITRRINTSITGLNLEHSTVYYLSVRAFDAQENFSENNLRSFILYDATPPSKPVLVPSETTIITFWPFPPPVFTQVASVPGWVEGKFNYPPNFNLATLDVEYEEAADPESGISHYEYILTSIANPGQAFQQTSDVIITADNEINLAAYPQGQDLISFTDSLYLHIRARNKAGASGEALTIDPAIAWDVTRPTRPTARIRVMSNSLRLYLPFLSLDAETQTVGYQYSIGTSPGQTNIRPWGSSIDFPQTEQLIVLPSIGHWYVSPDPTHVPVHQIPHTDLPELTNLYVNVRAVNGQGISSLPTSTGPFQTGTAPETPEITLSYNANAGELQMLIGNIFDAGASISSVKYRIRNNDTGQFLQSFYMPIIGAEGYYVQPGSVARSVSVPSSDSGYTVHINVTNSANISTIATQTYTHPINWGPIPPINF